jgi:diaminohydroxyphosphoribosylaminopyrimidine deaminase/5-amino-6-(5-phosphoribosylamino)uracil reductase
MDGRDIAARCLAEIAAPPPGRALVIAQLGQSLDGRIATLSGHSKWINGAHALDHLHALRAAVDAVVVGVGTVIADDPQLTVRRVAGTHPARVVIDPNGRVPDGARCFQDTGTRRYCVTGRACRMPDGVTSIIVEPGARGLAPGDIVAALVAHGLRRILIEGGADTISRFIDAGAVDRLHVLLAPVILGSGRPGLDLRPIATMAEALRPATRVHVFPDGDVLFDCDLRNTA